jgi:hypothetical protein
VMNESGLENQEGEDGMVTDGRAVVPFSNEELQRQLARQQWTAHNIRLTPKVTTISVRIALGAESLVGWQS